MNEKNFQSLITSLKNVEQLDKCLNEIRATEMDLAITTSQALTLLEQAYVALDSQIFKWVVNFLEAEARLEEPLTLLDAKRLFIQRNSMDRFWRDHGERVLGRGDMRIFITYFLAHESDEAVPLEDLRAAYPEKLIHQILHDIIGQDLELVAEDDGAIDLFLNRGLRVTNDEACKLLRYALDYKQLFGDVEQTSDLIKLINKLSQIGELKLTPQDAESLERVWRVRIEVDHSQDQKLFAAIEQRISLAGLSKDEVVKWLDFLKSTLDFSLFIRCYHREDAPKDLFKEALFQFVKKMTASSSDTKVLLPLVATLHKSKILQNIEEIRELMKNIGSAHKANILLYFAQHLAYEELSKIISELSPAELFSFYTSPDLDRNPAISGLVEKLLRAVDVKKLVDEVAEEDFAKKLSELCVFINRQEMISTPEQLMEILELAAQKKPWIFCRIVNGFKLTSYWEMLNQENICDFAIALMRQEKFGHALGLAEALDFRLARPRGYALLNIIERESDIALRDETEDYLETICKTCTNLNIVSTDIDEERFKTLVLNLMSKNNPKIKQAIAVFTILGRSVSSEVKTELLTGRSIFEKCAFYPYLDHEKDAELITEIESELKSYNDRFGVGALIYNLSLQRMNRDQILTSLDAAKHLLTFDIKDPYFIELRELCSFKERAKFLSLLIDIQRDESATARTRLKPALVIKIGDEEVLLREVQDIVLILCFDAGYIREEHLLSLAQNPAFIETLNKTINFHNAKFVGLDAYNLFQKINARIAADQPKIRLEDLLSFEELVKIKSATLKEVKGEVASDVKESSLYRAVLEASKKSKNSPMPFDEFYDQLSEEDRKNLGLLRIEIEEVEAVHEWLKAQLPELRKRYEGMKMSPARQELKVVCTDIESLEKLPSASNDFATSIAESMRRIKDLDLEKPEHVKNFFDNLPLIEHSTKLAVNGWNKFISNLEIILEWASLAANRDQFYSSTASALNLVMMPNCPANLSVLLNGQLEAHKKYVCDGVEESEVPKRVMEMAAFASALFNMSLDILNKGPDVIGIVSRYEKAIGGNNAYVPKNYFFSRLAEAYKMLEQVKEESLAPEAAALEGEVDISEEELEKMQQEVEVIDIAKGQEIFEHLVEPHLQPVRHNPSAAPALQYFRQAQPNYGIVI